jgi:hypothetical protein
MGNGGVYIWTDSNFAGSKINKQTKRKRDTRRKLQGRLNHCSKTLCDIRVFKKTYGEQSQIVFLSDYYQSNVIQIIVSERL